MRCFLVVLGLGFGLATAAVGQTVYPPPGASLTATQTFTGVNTFAPTAAVSPSASTWSAQSVAAGTSNTAGATTLFQGSLSTGSGVSGDFCIQTGGTGAGATAQNTAVTGFCVKGATQQLSLNGTKLWISPAAPTISSGFGSSPSVVTSNGTAAFTINVGTGGSASTGVVGLATATTGWACYVNDITTKSAAVSATQVTATTTASVTVGNFTDLSAAGPWAASDVLQFMCNAY